MTATEVLARRWPGRMPVQFRYTPGSAGARFFQTLKTRGVFTATRCEACGVTYLPPRLYCERCFADLEQAWTEVAPRGRVHTVTVLHVDAEGRRLARPEVAAFVRIDGTDGGFVTRLLGVEPGQAQIGQEVEAVLLPARRRTGTITDIAGFAPVGAQVRLSLPAARARQQPPAGAAGRRRVRTGTTANEVRGARARAAGTRGAGIRRGSKGPKGPKERTRSGRAAGRRRGGG